MKLSALTQGSPFIPPEWDREINHIHVDSRDVQAGDLFIARSGSQQDGRTHINDAIQRGASAVLAEGPIAFECVGYEIVSGGVPVFSTPDLKSETPKWLQRRYNSNNELPLIAVTGTNGKSSVTQYIAQLAVAVNQQVGILGTLGNGVWPELEETRNTTPDLSVVARLLNDMQQKQADLVAMEVSSHGIHQGRIEGLEFETAVLTNLTQDHLDYHGDMEGYFAAKSALFTDFSVKNALINIDDEYGVRLAKNAAVNADVVTYGTSAGALVRYTDINYADGLLTATLVSPWGDGVIRLPLIGDFNLANAVAAISVLCLHGFDFNQLLLAAEKLQPVAGRMELYRRQVSGKTQQAVIDFAHTPDALTNVMQAVNESAENIALVFGCGGDRDRSKRPLMAQAALTSKATVWLTDDNPRTENNEQIFSDVLSCAGAEQFSCEHDRSRAIQLACESDVELIVIAGKGHENYQDIAGVKQPYSDEAVLLQLGFEKAGGHDA